jgi:hypothetical protein
MSSMCNFFVTRLQPPNMDLQLKGSTLVLLCNYTTIVGYVYATTAGRPKLDCSGFELCVTTS